jgi:hypothetical protein
VLKWKEEKRSGLQVYSLLSRGCNTDFNKLGETTREGRYIKY